MSNFVQRLLTGAVFISFVLAGIAWNEYSYLLVFAVCVFLGMFEFKKLLTTKSVRIQAGWAFLIGFYMFFVHYYYLKGIISLGWFVLLIPMFLAVFVTELYRKSESPLTNIAYTLLTPLYIALPFASLHYIALYLIEYDPRPLLAFFVLIWCNDTFAYLAGRAFGKRRLFERVSPKKSWEGAIGGFLATLLAAYILSRIFPDILVWNFIIWLIIGAIISVAGVFGDLVESMIKRSVNKKDSGALLPGHGGVLDRFDGVLFAAPAVCCFLMILKLVF
ncbi:MAG: phosphatidate cytidylyltransferase [Cytophagaceae bacterium]|jgi:phosphatidate cytidylyltransferase|nr:phosphatidate cytidylyltransferase [Cytophagaceae bacterium]